jgi:hypothetical protein
VKLTADVRPNGLLLTLLVPLLTVAFRRQNVAAAARLQAVLERS